MKSLSVKPLTICILIFAACGFFSLFMSFRGPLSDFGNYYYGARTMSYRTTESAASVYDVPTFNLMAEQSGERGLFLNHTTVTPQSTIIYRLITWISSAAIAKMIFNVIGFVFFSLVFFRFLRWKNITITWPMVAIIFAAQVPLFYNLAFGQTYLFITGFLLIAIMQADNRPWLSGLLLGISISLKISPAIFLLWFLTQRKYKVVGWTLLFCALPFAWLLSDPRYSTETIAFYQNSLPRLMDGFVSDPYSSSFQSVIVFLRKLMLPDAILNPDALINASALTIQIINTIVFVALGYFLAGAWKEKQDLRTKFALLVLFVCITSGYTSTYSLILILPFIIVGNSQRDWIRAALYSIVFVLPPRIFDGYSPFLEEYKLWIFIALFIWEAKPEFSFRRVEKMQLLTGLLLTVIVIFKLSHRPEELPLTYYKPDKANQHYVLNAYVADHSVHYLAYVGNGFQMFELPYDGIASDGTAQNNYTHGVMWKVIGETDKEYLILSDYRRGPGLTHLYTVRKEHFNVLRAK